MTWDKPIRTQITAGALLEKRVGRGADLRVVYLFLGQDRQPQAMDGPAELRTIEDVQRVIAALEEVITTW